MGVGSHGISGVEEVDCDAGDLRVLRVNNALLGVGENGGVGLALVVEVRLQECFLCCPASTSYFEVGAACCT